MFQEGRASASNFFLTNVSEAIGEVKRSLKTLVCNLG